MFIFVYYMGGGLYKHDDSLLPVHGNIPESFGGLTDLREGGRRESIEEKHYTNTLER